MIPFIQSSSSLPEGFCIRVEPARVALPRLLAFNRPLALDLGLDADALATSEGAEIFSGRRLLPESEPVAMAYAGHQFGQFVPQLGDGRAILLGAVRDKQGVLRDIQLKGAGPTPFSRRGDGRAALGPVLREYLLSEAMAALGIPTTRALAAVATGETVWRERGLPGAVFTRVAASHLRIGSFQFFAARGEVDKLKHLADYAIARHDPSAATTSSPYLSFLKGVIARQAGLVASWLLVGFIHGVMNTDNMTISGETIDYGPCAFMDVYNPSTVFSSIDRHGRYAYNQQPDIALWNLCRLAECLLPLLAPDETQAIGLANEALAGFKELFHAAYQDGLRRKLGLFTSKAEDPALAQALLALMAEQEADFTFTFRQLCEASLDPSADHTLFPGFASWAVGWRARLAQEAQSPAARHAAMRAVNPSFIPRNHQVEAALALAIDQNDLSGFETLLHILATPYEDQPDFAAYATPPAPTQRPYQTFCGT